MKQSFHGNLFKEICLWNNHGNMLEGYPWKFVRGISMESRKGISIEIYSCCVDGSLLKE